jgi:hypothetical protein
MASSSNMSSSGPNLCKFELIALQTERIRSALRVDVSEGYVVIEFISHGPADVANVDAGYSLYYGPAYNGPIPVLSEKPGRSMSSIGQQQGSESYMWRDKSIGNSLKSLAQDWGHGTPDFDSIEVETKKSPVKHDELEQLLLAVWLEVFGHEVPDEEELTNRINRTRKKRKDLRAECFEWLRSGPSGVSKWNLLRVDEHKAVGQLGQCQFGGCDLSGVRFGNQNLRSSDFHEANLQGAHFGGADCRSVDFRKANLSESWLSGGKFLQADFSDACICNGALRAADCRGAIFSGTDLSGVDFSFADLRNVNLSSANLNEANFFRVKYDEQTIFPAGFFIDPELQMEWKARIRIQVSLFA